MSLPDKEFLCPYCGSSNAIQVDHTEGRHYQLVTDCETCCQPIVVLVRILDDDECEIEARPENE